MNTIKDMILLSENTLFAVSGGADQEKTIEPKLFSLSADAHSAQAHVGLQIPVTPNLSVTPSVQVDTHNGLTGGG